MRFSYCEGADAKGGTAIKAKRFYNFEKLYEVAWRAKAMIEIEEDDEQEELNPRLLFDS